MLKTNGSRRVFGGVTIGIAAMAVVVTASNILVQYPINDWLTWGRYRTRLRFWSPT